MKEIKQIKSNNYIIDYSPFSPCAGSGEWVFSRWDAEDREKNIGRIFIFGADNLTATIFLNSNKNIRFEDLALSKIKEYLGNDYFSNKLVFYFEFKNDDFGYCPEDPNWSKIPC